MANVNIIVTAIDKASGVLGNIGKGLGTIGVGAAAGIAALTTAIGVAINKTMDWGQTLDNIGDVLGTTASESAGLASMFKTIGGDANQLTSAMALMTKGLMNVDGKLGPTGEALKGLGIDFKDAQGKIKPSTKLFQEVADKLGNMPDGLEKTSLMMDIFGKSGKEMGDALNAAANGGMDNYIKQAEEMGLVLDPEQVIENKKAMATLELAITGIAVQIGKVFLPMIQQALKWLQSLFNDPKVKTGISTFTAMIQNAVAWVQTNWPKVEQTFKDVWAQIEIGIKWVEGIIQEFLVLVQTWWAENGEAIIATVTMLWERVVAVFEAGVEFVKTLVSFLVANIQLFWKTHGETVIGIVKWIWEAIQTIFTTLSGVVEGIFKGFTALLQGDFEGFKTYMLGAWDLLWNLIKTAAEAAWAGLSAWFQGVVQSIGRFFTETDWGAVGMSIINGVIEGLKAGIGALAQAAANVAKAAYDALVNANLFSIGGGNLAEIEKYGRRGGGGPVSGRTPYIVGEQGPELFVPNTSGVVIPNNRLPSTSGTTITVIGWAGDAASLAREIDRQAALERLLV